MTQGRPKCRKPCCTLPDVIRSWYEDYGESSPQIAKRLGVSSVHIAMRLKEIGVKMRSLGRYQGRRYPRPTSHMGISSSDLAFMDIVELESKIVDRRNHEKD